MASVTTSQRKWYKPVLPVKDIENGSYFQNDWKERKEEILFPGQHVPYLPWESFKWEDIYPQFPVDLEENFFKVPITIESLCHVTHEKEFDAICSDPYTLKSSEKKGKSGYEKRDGSPLGYSFKALHDSQHMHEEPTEESQYRYIKSEEKLLPGSYIWWSIEVGIPQTHQSDFNVSNALDTSCSPYGNKKIFGNVEHAFRTYQSSSIDSSTSILPRIELRNGGTLRYKFEVCYVVILCQKNEPELPYDQYPLWKEGDDKIEYDDSGAVSRVHTMTVTINNGIKYSKVDKQVFSWDQTVIGFYFPENRQSMKCEKGPNKFQDKNVNHNKCIKSRPIVPYGQWMCPNNIKDDNETDNEPPES